MWILFISLLKTFFLGSVGESSTVCLNLEVDLNCNDFAHQLDCGENVIRILDMRTNLGGPGMPTLLSCCDLTAGDCSIPFGKTMSYLASKFCSCRSSCGLRAEYASQVGAPEVDNCPIRPPINFYHKISSTIEYECLNASQLIPIFPGKSRSVTEFSHTTEVLHLVHDARTSVKDSRGGINSVCEIKVTDVQSLTEKIIVRTQDVRLQRLGNGSACSSVLLTLSGTVNSYTKRCVQSNELSTNFEDSSTVESSAAQTAVVSLENLFVQGTNDEPEMIWITVQVPRGASVTVTCSMTTELDKNPTEGKKHNLSDEDGPDETSIVPIVVPVICSLAAIGVVAVVIILYRRRQRLRDEESSKAESDASNRSEGDDTEYCTIPVDADDHSKDNSSYNKTDACNRVESNVRGKDLNNFEANYSTVIVNDDESKRSGDNNDNSKTISYDIHNSEAADDVESRQCYDQNMTGDYNRLAYKPDNSKMKSVIDDNYSHLSSCPSDYLHIRSNDVKVNESLPDEEYNHLRGTENMRNVKDSHQIKRADSHEEPILNRESADIDAISQVSSKIAESCETPITKSYSDHLDVTEKQECSKKLKRVDSYEEPVLKRSSEHLQNKRKEENQSRIKRVDSYEKPVLKADTTEENRANLKQVDSYDEPVIKTSLETASFELPVPKDDSGYAQVIKKK